MVNLREFGFDFDLRMKMITNFIDPHPFSNVLEINKPSPPPPRPLEREVNEGFVLALPSALRQVFVFVRAIKM